MVRQRRPLRVECDIRAELITGTVGVGRTGAVSGRVPAGKAVTGAGEAVGRQGRDHVGRLAGHRAAAAVIVEGDRVVGQRRPLGIERDISRAHGEGSTAGVSIARAAASSLGVPAVEVVARAHQSAGVG